MKNLYKLAFLVCMLVVAVSTTFAGGPAAPANLTVQPGITGGAILHWDSSANAGYYKVFKARDDGEFFPIGATEHLSFFDWATEPHHEYHYYVEACNLDVCSGPSSTVNFHVGPPPPTGVHGTVHGVVTDDSTGLPVREATIKFFRGHELWTVRTHTDTTGSYSVDLDTGRYIIRTEKFGYIPEWFDNVLELRDAQVVDLHQDSVVTADVGLRPFRHEVPVNVSGTVTDSVPGTPLRNAVVVFLRRPHLLRDLAEMEGEFGGFESERLVIQELGLLHGVAGVAFTDSNGNYTVHVKANERYIAFAFKPGFILKFWDNKYHPFEADRIGITQDTSGINFALVKNPLVNHLLSGTVHDSAGLGVPSHVMLLRLTPFGARVVRYRMTDSVGNYDFHYVVNGNFFVRAIPVDDYCPAWYNATACGVRSWHNADTIQVTGDVTGIDVCVRSSENRGFSGISGGINASPSNVDAVFGVQGVTVYAVDNATNEVVGYDVTEDDGSYSIGNLPSGTYNVVVDKEGYSATSAPTYTVDGSNDYQVSNASITVTPDGVTSVDDPVSRVPLNYRLEQNYPNPFNPSTAIRFEIPKTSTVSLKIYNLIGQEVAVLSNTTLTPGTFTMHWNGTDHNGINVSSGIYFIKLTATPLDGSSLYNQTRKISLMR